VSVRSRLCLFLIVATLGCTKLLNGRCDTDGDCPTNYTCDNTKTCVAKTGVGGAAGTGGAGGKAGAAGGMAGSLGGAGGAAGSLGGAGGKPFTCPNTMCGGSKPICDVDAGACVVCEKVPGSCGSADGGTPFCAPVDAGSKGGTCVGCLANSECKGTTPICELGDAGASRNSCRMCASTSDCTQLSATTPVCVTTANAPGGAQRGTCVMCLMNSDCTAEGGATTTKPICELTMTNAGTPVNTCRKCTADTECGGPGVCMLDGHCATDAETIYVKNDGMTTCNDSPPDGSADAGTKAHPFCSMAPILGYVSTNRDLVLVDGSTAMVITVGTWIYADQASPNSLTIVGQQSPTIGTLSSNPLFNMSSGTVRIRGVTFSPSPSIGINATGGSLFLDGVTVDSCKGGGIVLNGATFDIENTTVTNNGSSGTIGGVNISSAGAGSLLNLVTITNNKPAGITCGGGVNATGVYVMSNTGSQIVGLCGFNSCTQLGSGCGAP
jgi:hypothetical protein